MQDDETPPSRVERRWRVAAEYLGLVRQQRSSISESTPWWMSILSCLAGAAAAITVMRWLSRRDQVFDDSWLVSVAVLAVVLVIAIRLGEARERRKASGGNERDG